MSDPANTEQESAEPTVMKTYNVELTMTSTAFVTVEAEDEDYAHDAAKDEGYMLPMSDWDTDSIIVENITELES